MLTEEFKKNFAIFIRHNSEQKENLIKYMTSRICECAREKRPPEQIVGMVNLLDDLLRLDERYLK